LLEPLSGDGHYLFIPTDRSTSYRSSAAVDLHSKTLMNIDAFIRTVATPSAEFAWAWALEHPASEPLSVRVVPALAEETSAPPSENELVLWFGAPEVGAPETLGGPNLLAALSDDERTRAVSFRFDADRWAFAAAHTGLRRLLGPMLGCAPRALRFRTDVNGKLHLDRKDRHPAVQFSLSHTRGCVSVAVAGRPVGVDVERRRELSDLMAVARTTFAPEAYATLAARPESPARTALFYRYWTLGEAFIKATGEGIAQDLKSFAFTEKGAPALTRVDPIWGPTRRWRFFCHP
jgi:4'-phosphopantetheinyl transferase